MQVPLIRLRCGVNSYDWGKIGHSSAAARFAAATPTPSNDSLSIESEKPYAELWMGTHPSNPSSDVSTGRTLADMLEDNVSLLGSPALRERFASKLPFLFKVLSINKALSIQAHPNKKLAEELHARDPRNYPDDNHKPEMTIAVTDFEGLCGFRPLEEIAHFLESVPSLRALVGEDTAREFIFAVRSSTGNQDSYKAALKSAFSALMQANPTAVSSASSDLVSAAAAEQSSFAGSGVTSTDGATLSELIDRLHTQFPNDIGLFVLFFLNYVTLSPGEALFLRADDIHAYLSGDIIECMAASDNVVRAGFTPKFKDVPALVDLLTYDFAPIDQQKMQPVEFPYAILNRPAYSSNSSVLLYDPPIDEFAVVRTVLRGCGGPKVTFEAVDGPSIVICTAGKGRIAVGPTEEEIREGWVYFVGATAELVLVSEGEGAEDELVAFRAFCEGEEGEEAQGVAGVTGVNGVNGA